MMFFRYTALLTALATMIDSGEFILKMHLQVAIACRDLIEQAR
jgi:hypothetical protein